VKESIGKSTYSSAAFGDHLGHRYQVELADSASIFAKNGTPTSKMPKKSSEQVVLIQQVSFLARNLSTATVDTH
jgi:hypothetical protein